MPIEFKGRQFGTGIWTERCAPTPEVTNPHTRRRSSDIDLIVLHWTGGEGGACQVQETLRRRRLSIHFIVDRAGTIWQTCDPAKTVCYHAGKFNARSIGIEIVNYGARRPYSKRWNVGMVPSKARDRAVYAGHIGDKEMWFADFYLSQRLAAVELVKLLCEVANVPRRIPETIGGIPVMDHLDELERYAFTGVCGHFHLSNTKIDPGTAILEDVNNAFLQG